MNTGRTTSSLSIGEHVSSNDGLNGVVIESGPYGDTPFQIRRDTGEIYSFIEEDGTCSYNKRKWVTNGAAQTRRT